MNLADRTQTCWLMRPDQDALLLSFAYLNLFQLFSPLAPAACAFLLLQALPMVDVLDQQPRSLSQSHAPKPAWFALAEATDERSTRVR